MPSLISLSTSTSLADFIFSESAESDDPALPDSYSMQDANWECIEQWIQTLELQKNAKDLLKGLGNMPTAAFNAEELANGELGKRLSHLFKGWCIRDLQNWLSLMHKNLDMSCFPRSNDSERISLMKLVTCPQRFLFVVFQNVLKAKNLQEDFKQNKDFQALESKHNWLLTYGLVNR